MSFEEEKMDKLISLSKLTELTELTELPRLVKELHNQITSGFQKVDRLVARLEGEIIACLLDVHCAANYMTSGQDDAQVSTSPSDIVPL